MQGARLKPKKLQAGDSIMFISPAAGLAGLIPHRVENGQKALEKMGYRVIHGSNSGLVGESAGTPEQRAADIYAGLQNPAVKALISNIGGNYVCSQILPYLDWDLIRQNPKIFMGYSDVTALLLAIYQQTGLITFYGPAVMSELAEFPEMHSYTKNWMLQALTQTQPLGALEPSPEWTEEALDWMEKLDLTRPRQMQASGGWEWLQGGQAEGRLVGGCIQVLRHMLEVMPEYVPDFKDTLFFWESAEKDLGVGYSPAEVAADLQFLKEKGILAGINGMIVGRPYVYSPGWHAELKQHIIQILAGPSKPVIYNVEIGHTAPMLTIPIGVQGKLDSTRNLFSIEEAGVTA